MAFLAAALPPLNRGVAPGSMRRRSTGPGRTRRASLIRAAMVRRLRRARHRSVRLGRRVVAERDHRDQRRHERSQHDPEDRLVDARTRRSRCRRSRTAAAPTAAIGPNTSRQSRPIQVARRRRVSGSRSANDPGASGRRVRCPSRISFQITVVISERRQERQHEAGADRVDDHATGPRPAAPPRAGPRPRRA